ncbi:MAG: acetyl-CoA hydrolase [Pirellulales bacterium]|nr:acetyl-CoA hydrolase [Pirellulales bacterium]
MYSACPFPRISADEAAAMIFDGALVAFSGFTPAGAAKAVPRALAARAARLAEHRQPVSFRVLTSASTGTSINDPLMNARAVSWRAPYQCHRQVLRSIVQQELEFVDFHLSDLPGMVEAGFLGKVDYAVVEAIDLVRDGRIYLSSSVGASPSFLRRAEKVIVEINHYHSSRLVEMHDIGQFTKPPYHAHISLENPLDRFGVPFATVDPSKVVGIVEVDESDEAPHRRPADAASDKIAEHIAGFLANEMRSGRVPPDFLPVQGGVGNIVNAVMGRLGRCEDLPPFVVYGDVVQDSMIELMENDRIRGASATSLALSPEALQRVYDHMDFFAPRIVLRPQEFTNSPALIRRLGVIAINGIVEMDVWGRTNCTHLYGRHAASAVGASDDFARHAYLSFLVAPSISHGGRVSTVVPMVSHVDHSEHSVQILVTEQGLADLRGLGPLERARSIIENCAHPMYRDYLYSFLQSAPLGHLSPDLSRSFDLHNKLFETGSMLPAESYL